MMPEPLTSPGPTQTPVRPFPWFCPRCRRQEVRRTTIRYECSRSYNGQPITVVLANLVVPRCDNCGELVFDYDAEHQINLAYQAQTKDRLDGDRQEPGTISEEPGPKPLKTPGELVENMVSGVSHLRRTPNRRARRHFLNELRTARAQAQKNAEDFADLLIAFERLGAYVAVDDDGGAARNLMGLGDYEGALCELAQHSSLGGDSLEEGSRRWHSTFKRLFCLVKDARNSALHEGAKARHLTEHAIELSLVLEEAMRRMHEELEAVSDLMVRSPVIAEVWQPISFVRQVMLTNSFSFLPIFIDDAWKLLSDHFVAHYLHKANSNAQRRVLMAKNVQKAIEECPEMPLPKALTISDTASISELLKLRPAGEPVNIRFSRFAAVHC
jgi:hypothetical protein